MALNKKIGLGNGVVINYHRVVSVNIITNVQNVVEVSGYTSRTKRSEERAAIEACALMDIYIDTRILSAPYDPAMTVDTAYAWLKMLPEYEGATDVLEDGQGEEVI